MHYDHDHEWEPTFRLSHLAGTPHRRCNIEGCDALTLDSPECDCGDYDDCPSCHAWAVREVAQGWSPNAGRPFATDAERDGWVARLAATA